MQFAVSHLKSPQTCFQHCGACAEVSFCHLRELMELFGEKATAASKMKQHNSPLCFRRMDVIMLHNMASKAGVGFSWFEQVQVNQMLNLHLVH